MGLGGEGAMRYLRLVLVAAAWFGLQSAPVHAFDEVFHYTMVYAAAAAMGFSREEADVIARASYSLDDNDSTTAFSVTLLGREGIEVGRQQYKLVNAPHMQSGQVFHALSEQRSMIEQAHLARIRRVFNDPQEPGTSDQKHLRQLVYLGEYLHFVADMVVHPKDPFLGHGPQGHFPDRADLHPDQLRIALHLMSEKVQEFREGQQSGGRGLRATAPAELTKVPTRIVDAANNQMLEQVAQSVADSWEKSYPKDRQDGKGLVANALGDTYIDLLEKERIARAASEAARVLNANGLQYPVYQKIELDSNGEPIGVCGRTTGCDRSAANAMFGTAKGINVVPFAAALAESNALREERQVSVGMAAIRGLGAVPPNPASEWASNLTQSTIDQIRKAAAWVPPSAPGGVALDPRLAMPSGIGMPQRIEATDDALYIVNSNGKRFLFKGISARSFATVARAIAAGQIPFVTIGTDPSDRVGYARVTYAPAFAGTVEGYILYHADLQFKRIFARLPFEGSQPAWAAQLVKDYPGPGGEFLRFWITSSDIKLDLDGDRLVPVANGMRILSETRLHFSVQSDPEMENYTDNLTRHWDDIASELWPFRGVEVLARTTAIVFWARDHGVDIDPIILLMPPRAAITPDYAPLVAVLDNSLRIAGGVALTPEDKSTLPGRAFLTKLRKRTSTEGNTSVLFGALAVLIVVMTVPALCYWFLIRSLAGGALQLKYVQSLRLWGMLYLAQVTIVFVLSPLISGDTLSFFDRDLVALLSTFVAFPILLFAVTYRLIGRTSPLAEELHRRHSVRLAVLALGLAGPVLAGQLGNALAVFTAAIGGLAPTPGLNYVLTSELATDDAFLQSLVGTYMKPGNQQISYLPVQRSLIEVQRSQYQAQPLPKEGYFIRSSTKDKLMPWEQLNRIEWPPNVQVPNGTSQYSPDGKSPL
jgi:hypothetical protein